MTLILLAGFLVCLPSLAASGAAVQPVAGDVTGAPDCVKDFLELGVESILPDGSRVAAQEGDGLGKAHIYGDNGTRFEQIVPPETFQPFDGTDGELTAYGLQPRPKDPALLDHWRSLYQNYKYAGVSPVCGTAKHANTASANWAGAVANAGTFHQVQIGFNQTGFDAVCPGASSYSSWAGIGGYYGNKELLQSGTDTSNSSLNGVYKFWEAIDTRYDTGEMIFGRPVAPGDVVYASTDYFPPPSPSTGRVAFSVIDQTNGYTDTVQVYSYASDPISSYYMGGSAEYITERPSGGPVYVPATQGHYYYLRRPHLGNTYIFWAYANLIQIQNFGRFALDTTPDGGYGLPPLQQTTFVGPPSGGGTAPFVNNWKACS